MRQSLALPGLIFLVGGCSIIYNPDHITGSFDAMVDAAPIDANPAALTLTQVDSPILLEGQGTGASRKALLVIEGTNLVAGATVTIAGAASVVPDQTAIVATATSDLIAVPVTAMIHSGTTPSPTPISLTVTVTQMSGAGPVSATIGWQLQELAELTTAGQIQNTSAIPVVYSHVAVSGGTFSYASATHPVIVQAVGDLSITGIASLSVNASGVTGGPGGGNGGATKFNGTGTSTGFGKVGDAGDGGGGAGFANPGVPGGSLANGGDQIGDALIKSYLDNGGSGGGGGFVNAITGLGGSAGGGGGGTIELSAGGDLTAPAITANGAAGAGSCGGGSCGGGGSGGVIVLRAGHAVTVPSTSVAGQAGGIGSGGLLGSSTGGSGSDGRARVDAMSGSPGGATQGAMFDNAAPYTVMSSSATIKLFGGGGNSFDLHDVDENFQDLSGTTPLTFQINGTTYSAMLTLVKGMNHLCVVPTGGTLAHDESRNCIYVAYLP